MKFAIISLIMLPPVLLLSAYISMKIKTQALYKPTDDDLHKLAQNAVCCVRALCIEIQKYEAKKNERTDS